MSQICPHCAYIRKAADQAPDWQCPSCGKAYVKAGAEAPLSRQRHDSPLRQEDTGTRMPMWLVWLVILGAALWIGRPLWQQKLPVPLDPVAGQPAVVLYATDWCGYCKATRDFFQANGIHYVEHDIEKSSAAHNEHARLGGQGVPLVLIGDHVIKGYNEGTMRQLLRPWIKG